MEQVIHSLESSVHVAAGVLGVVVFYLAAFLWEGEEDEIQNTLTAWWVKVDDLAQELHSKQLAFLQRMATSTLRGMEWLFGRGLLSWRSTAVSASLSLSTTAIFFMSTAISGEIPRRGLAMLAFLVAGAMVARHSEASARIVVLVLVLLVGGTIIVLIRALIAEVRALGMWHLTTAASYLPPLVFVYAAIVLSVLSDILSIIVTRRVVKHLASSPTVANAVFLLCVDVVLVVALVAVPYFAATVMTPTAQSSVWWDFVGSLFGAVAVFNVTTTIPSVAYASVAGLVLVHLAVWPGLGRLLYPAARHQIVKNKKLLFAASAALLTYAGFPFLPSLANLLARWL